ncbi:hypothetical protein PROFUN_02080 [Planoprotostelium fungivorum]|uniref:WH1 domain-containing protein n=1 Tax=Planoprotostelium fungivorum TaxID=1890364 RepID=A0A2P6NBB7_9EUKA|nr:hypothetical protein PROFUN_02080 [Planoprotostelium fungivorum]
MSIGCCVTLCQLHEGAQAQMLACGTGGQFKSCLLHRNAPRIRRMHFVKLAQGDTRGQSTPYVSQSQEGAGIAEITIIRREVLGQSTTVSRYDGNGWPQGQGTLYFADGYRYEGQWDQGQQHGKGTLWMNNGDIYEGDWFYGNMQGQGVLSSANGDVYEGQWMAGSQSGYGKLRFANGDIFEGQWIEGHTTGEGILIYALGGRYEGEWLNGLQHGYGKRTYADGMIYVGQWRGGQRSGRGILYTPEGQIRYDGEWQGGLQNGQGVFYYADGGVYNGQWQDGHRHGMGQRSYVDGNQYQGEWKEGWQCGQGVLRYANGDQYTGEWRDGQQNGFGTHKSVNGSRYEGQWEFGMRNGFGIKYYTDGSRYEGQWNNHWQNGTGYLIFPDGDNYHGEWRDGEMSGQGVFQCAEGGRYEGEWRNKRPNGRGICLYAEGERYEGEWRDGQSNGEGVIYYSDGTKFEGNWQDNQRNGGGTVHFSNGERYYCVFVNDQMDQSSAAVDLPDGVRCMSKLWVDAVLYYWNRNSNDWIPTGGVPEMAILAIYIDPSRTHCRIVGQNKNPPFGVILYQKLFRDTMVERESGDFCIWTSGSDRFGAKFNSEASADAFYNDLIQSLSGPRDTENSTEYLSPPRVNTTVSPGRTRKQSIKQQGLQKHMDKYKKERERLSFRLENMDRQKFATESMLSIPIDIKRLETETKESERDDETMMIGTTPPSSSPSMGRESAISTTEKQRVMKRTHSYTPSLENFGKSMRVYSNYSFSNLDKPGTIQQREFKNCSDTRTINRKMNVAPTEDTGATRDRYKIFRTARKETNVRREADHERITHKYSLLSFTVFSAINESQNNSSWFSRAPNPNAIAASTVAGHQDDSPFCHICKTMFTGLFKTKFVCPICLGTTCKNHSQRTHPLVPPKLYNNQQPVDVIMCDKCIDDITLSKKKDIWKREMEESMTKPIVKNTTLMMELMKTIELDLQKAREIMSIDIQGVHTRENEIHIKTLDKLLKEINIFFSNLEKAMKQVAGTIDETADKRQQSVVNNIKNVCQQFVSTYLPEFRIMSRELTMVSKLPITERREESYTLLKPRNTESQGMRKAVTLPTIVTVNPAVLPTSGGNIIITGENFSNRVKVYVVNEKENIQSNTATMRVEYIDSMEVKVSVPPGPEGPKKIRVINPDGGFADLNGIFQFFSALDQESDMLSTFVSAPSAFGDQEEEEEKKRPSASQSSSRFNRAVDIPKRGQVSPRSTPPSSYEERELSFPEGMQASHDVRKPNILSIEPAAAPLKGGNRIRIRGSGFASNSSVWIGGEKVLNVVYRLPHDQLHTLTFDAPPMRSPGFASLIITNPGGGTAEQSMGILYNESGPDATPRGRMATWSSAEPEKRGSRTSTIGHHLPNNPMRGTTGVKGSETRQASWTTGPSRVWGANK